MNYLKNSLIIFLLILLSSSPIYSMTLYDKIEIPNPKVLTYNENSCKRLESKFINTLITNKEIQTILQEMARDMNVRLIPFIYKSDKGIKFLQPLSVREKQIIKTLFKKQGPTDGYFFYVKYKSSKRDDIINISLYITEFAMGKVSPITNLVSGIMIPLLKDKVFKVTKYHQLKKFNKRYHRINTILTEALMQTYMNDIQENPKEYKINKIIIYTRKLYLKNSINVEIHAEEVYIDRGNL